MRVLHFLALLAVAFLAFLRPLIATTPAASFIGGDDTTKGKQVVADLKAIVIPAVNWKDVKFRDAVNFLNIESKELGSARNGHPVRWIYFWVPEPDDTAEDSYFQQKISIAIQNVSLFDLLAYVCQQAEVQCDITTDRSVNLFSPAFGKARAVTLQKLQNLILKGTTLKGVDVTEAIAFLNKKIEESGPERGGFKIVLRKTEGNFRHRVSIEVRGAPMLDILEDIAFQTGLEYRIEPDGVVFNLWPEY